ncbi:S-adenosylmethionine:tRNA ribosyltransferase-isomerase [Cupriavidus basilensis]
MTSDAFDAVRAVLQGPVTRSACSPPARWRPHRRPAYRREALFARLDAPGAAASRPCTWAPAPSSSVRTENLAEHKMHAEQVRGVRGTGPGRARHAARAGRPRASRSAPPSLRALESAGAADGTLAAGRGDTDIFITPGYRFRVVDALITNFHLAQVDLADAGIGAGRVELIRARLPHARWRSATASSATATPCC